MLTEGEPVMLLVDMGFLPYFDFGEEYHFATMQWWRVAMKRRAARF